MPTLFILFGFRFFFGLMSMSLSMLSKGDAEAKYNVETIELVDNFGFKKNELKMIESILEENKDIIIARWKECFNKKNK